MMKTPRNTFQNLPKKKQERITRVAMEEFSSKGFNGASINTMVDRLNIAKGSMFQYFGDKKGLFLFVFNQSVEMVKGYLKTVRSKSADEDLQTRLYHTLSAGIRFIRQHPVLYRLYLRVLFESKAPFRDEILSSLRIYSIEYLRSLLEAARDKGELRDDIDIDSACFVLDAVMDRFLQAQTVRHLDAGLGVHNAAPAGAEHWSKQLVKTICRGIEKQGAFETADRTHILVSAAVDRELSGLAEKLENRMLAEIGSRTVLSGTLDGVSVKLLATGPGMVNAAQAITAAIEDDRPALILQTGSGGVFKKSGLSIGDIAIATEEIDIHSGIENPSNGCRLRDLPFALIESKNGKYRNRFPADPNLVDTAYRAIAAAFAASGVLVKKGRFITVSTITATDKRMENLYNEFAPCMEQMEGAAAAHISMLYGIPFLEIRSASNMVGRRDTALWDLPKACKNSAKAVHALIQQLAEDKLMRLIRKNNINT